MNSDRVQTSPFFDALMDAAADAIIFIDKDGSILRFNKSAQRLFGFSEEEALGENVNLLMPETHRRKHDGYLRKYMDTGEAAIIGKGREEFGMRKSGEVFPIRLSVGQAQVGEDVFFVGIIHDLSQRHATEKKLRELEQQLFHADRLLTLGEMTAGIAHEINQPLTAISAYADAASHLIAKSAQEVDPAVHDICARISQQSRRAASVLDHLRELVRKGASRKTTQDIRDIINNTLLLFDYEIKKHNIDIQIRVPDHLARVYVDEVQIQQILVNLLKNSLDSMIGAGRDRGCISLETEERKGELLLTVTDNGPGVSEESLPHLFEPFYTNKPNGMGLGLSICKNIALSHGGSLTYRAVPEGGASFILALPQSSIG